MATQREIADRIGLSERQVRNLISEGVLRSGPNGLDRDECYAAYVRHQRKLSKHRHMSPSERKTRQVIEDAFNEILGKQYLPRIWDMLLSAGSGILLSKGLSKSGSVEVILDFIHLIMHRTDECCPGHIDFEMSPILVELAKAQGAGTLDECVRKYWPDTTAPA